MATFVQLLSLLSTNGVNHVNKLNSIGLLIAKSAMRAML